MHSTRRFAEAVKTMLVGGLFVIIPVLMLILALKQVLGIIVMIATPIADMFPSGTFDKMSPTAQFIAAVGLLLGASFLVGLLTRAIFAKRLGIWFETKLLGKIPMYEALRRLTQAFRDADSGTGFRSALLVSSDGASRQPAYLVEELEGGLCTVLLPFVPAGFTGTLAIVARSRVELLNISLAEYTRHLGTWGIGLGELVKQSEQAKG